MFLAVNQYLSETTVHGLIHFTGERRSYIKLIWLLAVLASFSYCTLRVSDAYRRFVSKEVATTVRANALEFDFPDVYICNENSISGSYSVTLSAEDSDLLSQYRRKVNSKVSALGISDPDSALENFGIRMANSLPFKFLSDKLGHRLSSILFFFLEGNADWVGAIHHDPFFLNCFSLNLTAKDRAATQNPSNIIQVILFLDPPVPRPTDNSTEDNHNYAGGIVNIKPIDWDPEYGLDFTISNGFRVFLTPKGQRPSAFDSQLVVGPGQQHRVVIKMQDIVYNEADFVNQCDGSSEATADYFDPYSGGMLTYKYSHAVCFHREVARLSQERFNCSVWRMPLPWEYRSLSSCFNISQFSGNYVLNGEFYSKRAAILDLGRRTCERKVPCRSRSYTNEYSSSRWPSDREWQQFLRSYLTQSKVNGMDGVHIPGIKHLVYNSSTEAARESLVQLTLSAADRMSPESQLSLAYSFNSLIADVGGLLGLFLGMSLLSVLEVVELLHGCAEVVIERSRKSSALRSDRIGSSCKVTGIATIETSVPQGSPGKSGDGTVRMSSSATAFDSSL